jgi:hypothetical protein
MLTDIEIVIQEWFADASINGKVEVAKLYAEMRIEMDKQLEFILESGEETL